ncbi:MAG: ParB/RepB/Spo0J family partition protein [Bacillota bacterium]|nr:ParB/RepB/Spo0J family partition protein [Bacillota bacterium]
MNKQRLGRGLDALIPKEEYSSDRGGIVEIPLEKIKPNPLQPRKEFNEEKLNALAETIKSYGVIQPLIVQKDQENYVLVAGERRLRAARLAGLKVVPVVVNEYDHNQLMEIALVENLQREDLNPIEEASSYKKLIDEFGLLQEDLAKKLGKSRSSITNSMRLLLLDNDVKKYLAEGRISVGQARPLLSLATMEEQKSIALQIINKGLSARQVEKMLKSLKKEIETSVVKEESTAPSQVRELLLKEMEDKIRKVYGTKVSIKSGLRDGRVEIFFYDDQDLDRLVELLLK